MIHPAPSTHASGIVLAQETVPPAAVPDPAAESFGMGGWGIFILVVIVAVLALYIIRTRRRR